MKKLFLTLALLGSFACGKKTQIIDREVTRWISNEKVEVENTWGLPFYYKSLAYEQDTQTLAQASAVAKVYFLMSGSATGFFVSPDGYFLTNHHVINNKYCSKQKCLATKIVRDHRLGGVNHIYSDLSLIASNEDLDYALIKVNLPEGERVPFLHLDNLSTVKELNEELPKQELKLFGHTFSAALKETNAFFYDMGEEDIRLKSIVLSGSSGSPLILSKRKKVIGLYKASYWDKETVNLEGKVEHFGLATPMITILKHLKELYSIEISPETGLSLLDNTSLDPNSSDLPMDRSKFENIDNWEKFLTNFIDDPQFVSVYEKELNKFLDTPDPNKNKIDQLVFKYFDLYKNFAPKDYPKFRFGPETIVKLKNFYKYSPEKYDYTLSPLLDFFGERDDLKCLANFSYVREKKDYLYYWYTLGQYCHLDKGIDNQLILAKLMDYLQQAFIKKTSLDFARILSIIRDQLRISKNLSSSQIERLIDVLKQLNQQTDNLALSSTIEELTLQLQENVFWDINYWSY